MKKLKNIILLSSLLLFQQNIFAQFNVTINEIGEFMSMGEKTGVEVLLLDADPDQVAKDWKKFMKKYKTKAKQPKKSNEIFADNATIKDMSANTVDVYAIVRPSEYGTKLAVFYNLGGSFVSSQEHPVAFGAAKKMLHEFALEEARIQVDNELDEQNSVLKDLNKELDKMLSSKSKSVKEVEKAKALIEQREQDLAELKQAIETKEQQLSLQKEIIETLKQKTKGLK
ncbi:MAG: hypothetical protein R2728_03345 [Chitinophagales bacterium]